MGVFEDRVVDNILDQFNSLPSKCKPILSPNGHHDCVPLSGVVLTKGADNGPHPRFINDFTNEALG